MYQYDDLATEPALLYDLPSLAPFVSDPYSRPPSYSVTKHLVAAELDSDGRDELVV